MNINELQKRGGGVTEIPKVPQLREEQVLALQELYRHGVSVAESARFFSVSPSAVSQWYTKFLDAGIKQDRAYLHSPKHIISEWLKMIEEKMKGVSKNG